MLNEIFFVIFFGMITYLLTRLLKKEAKEYYYDKNNILYKCKEYTVYKEVYGASDYPSNSQLKNHKVCYEAGFHEYNRAKYLLYKFSIMLFGIATLVMLCSILIKAIF